ncbi:hypothetical protein KFE25_007040 [Diacronema lutheri]|uniref:non-specific serine/threonine protein kinase n=1 Tax=Diacronema lutheri TaxID=2081491 RepID=A0A8J5XI96_DIALT|nr:hypothetical protein KFE25_007040 [Diacronema lutheri]
MSASRSASLLLLGALLAPGMPARSGPRSLGRPPNDATSYVVVPTAHAEGLTLWHEPAGSQSPRVGPALPGSAMSIEQRLRTLTSEHARLGDAITGEWEQSALKRRKLRIKDEICRLTALAHSRALAPYARVLGAGSEGRVLLGRALPLGEAVAMKCEAARPLDECHLWQEFKVTRKMGGARGFARAHAFFERADVLGVPSNVLVLDLLGPSLDDLFWATREVLGTAGLSAETVLALLHDALSRVQHVGARGFAHADIKPENLLLGRTGKRRGVLHLVDFGASERLGAQAQSGGGFVGTPRYAALRAHAVACGAHAALVPAGAEELAATRIGADIESLLYSMAAMATGTLPWDGCLDSSGRIVDGREAELVRAKAAATAGEDTSWAGPAGSAVRPTLLALMAQLHAGGRAGADRGARTGGAIDFARARALVRHAYCAHTGRTRMCREGFDWDAAGVSWPEGDDEVADAVMSSAAAGRAASAELTVLGGVSLLTHRASRSGPAPKTDGDAGGRGRRPGAAGSQ